MVEIMISLLPKIQSHVEELCLISHYPSPQKAEVGSLPVQGKSRVHSETLSAQHIIDYCTECESMVYFVEKQDRKEHEGWDSLTSWKGDACLGGGEPAQPLRELGFLHPVRTHRTEEGFVWFAWLGLVLFGVGVFKIGYHFIFRLPLTPRGAQVGLKLIANLLPQLLCAGNINMSLHTHHLEWFLKGSNPIN